MSLFSKITNYQRTDWYPLKGAIEFISDGKVKFTPDLKQKDIYAVLDENSINEDFIHPIVSPKTGSSINTIYEFQVKKGSEVELHSKGSQHTFTLDPNEKKFYVDPKSNQFVFLNYDDDYKNNVGCDAQAIADADLHTLDGDSCCQWVTLFFKGCCSTNHDPGFTVDFVGCPNPIEPTNQGCWHNDHYCP